MNPKKFVKQLLVISYSMFFATILFWILAGVGFLGKYEIYMYIVMGFLLAGTIMLIGGLTLMDRFYWNNTQDMKNLENLTLKLRTQRHEYLNEMQVVHGLLELEEYEEARKYLEPIFQDIAKVNKALKTSMPAINALLQAKLENAEKRQIDFYLEISSNLAELKMDQWELCKILANLIDNAFTAVEQNAGEKKVHVEISEASDHYRFCVYNNGPVILPEEQKLIFKQGYSTKKEEGHGLGLAIIREILEYCNGEITVDSRKGKTMFTVQIQK